LEHGSAVAAAEFLGPGNQRSISCNLVVFDGLCRGDQGCV
jgi:hypothetical protein